MKCLLMLKLRKSESSQGFTLVEILVVLAILASLISIGLPRILPKKTNLKKTLRHFRVLSKEVRNHARLNHRIYRIVLQMDPKKGFLYWTEKANEMISVLPASEENEEQEEQNSSKSQKAQIQNPLPFSKATKLMKRPKQLPKGIVFLKLEKKGDTAKKSGLGYIHFFPSGRVEESAIYIGKPEHFTWTLFTHPLTGEMRIVQEEKTLEDLFPSP